MALVTKGWALLSGRSDVVTRGTNKPEVLSLLQSSLLHLPCLVMRTQEWDELPAVDETWVRNCCQNSAHPAPCSWWAASEELASIIVRPLSVILEMLWRWQGKGLVTVRQQTLHTSSKAAQKGSPKTADQLAFLGLREKSWNESSWNTLLVTRGESCLKNLIAFSDKTTRFVVISRCHSPQF